MKYLSIEDVSLLNSAKDILKKSYDPDRHPSSAAIRVKSGQVFTGIDIISHQTTCATSIAISSAIMAGEKEFDTLIIVHGKDGKEILPPCGSCIQLLTDYMPNGEVILPTKEGIRKVPVPSLMPFTFQRFRKSGLETT